MMGIHLGPPSIGPALRQAGRAPPGAEKQPPALPGAREPRTASLQEGQGGAGLREGGTPEPRAEARGPALTLVARSRCCH